MTWLWCKAERLGEVCCGFNLFSNGIYSFFYTPGPRRDALWSPARPSIFGNNLWRLVEKTLRATTPLASTAPSYTALVSSPHCIFRSLFSLISVAATSSLCVSPKVEQCVYLVSPREPYHFFEFHFFDFP